MENLPYTNDHDLLIAVHTNMKHMQTSLEKIETNTNNWDALLESKADKKEIETRFVAIEAKIDIVTTFKDTLTGKLIGFGAAISAVTAIVTLLATYFLPHSK